MVGIDRVLSDADVGRPRRNEVVAASEDLTAVQRDAKRACGRAHVVFREQAGQHARVDRIRRTHRKLEGRGAVGRQVERHGMLLYKPRKRFLGTDSFTYTIRDENGGADTARVTVVVTKKHDDKHDDKR